MNSLACYYCKQKIAYLKINTHFACINLFIFGYILFHRISSHIVTTVNVFYVHLFLDLHTLISCKKKQSISQHPLVKCSVRHTRRRNKKRANFLEGDYNSLLILWETLKTSYGEPIKARICSERCRTYRINRVQTRGEKSRLQSVHRRERSLYVLQIFCIVK